MTDEQTWQAPGAAPTPPPAPGFGAGTPPPPPIGQPGFLPGYQPGYLPVPPPGYSAGPSASYGWTPPPKPGLIPLRPLSLGTILGASFQVLRRNPRPTFGIALLVQSVVTIITVLGVGFVTVAALSRLETAAQVDEDAIAAGTFGALFLTMVFAVFLGLIASTWLQGIVVLEVSRGSLGEKRTLRQLLALAKGRLGALIGWASLVAGILIVALSLIAAVIWLLVATMGPLGIGLGVLLGVLSGLGLLVVGVWIGTKLSLVPSALMIERLTIRDAITRSWTLTNQAFWKTFGIQLLVSFIVGIAVNIITAPFSVLAPILLTLLDPNGTGSSFAIGAYFIVIGIQLIVTVVIGAIAAIIQSATTALIYLDLRMRKEGLDLEMTKYVEARQAGSTTLRDPFLRPGTPVIATAGLVSPSAIDSPWA